MTVTIQPTGDVYSIGGICCRLWTGRAEDGAPVKLFVRLLETDRTTTKRFTAEVGLIPAEGPGDSPRFSHSEPMP